METLLSKTSLHTQKPCRSHYKYTENLCNYQCKYQTYFADLSQCDPKWTNMITATEWTYNTNIISASYVIILNIHAQSAQYNSIRSKLKPLCFHCPNSWCWQMHVSLPVQTYWVWCGRSCLLIWCLSTKSVHFQFHMTTHTMTHSVKPGIEGLVDSWEDGKIIYIKKNPNICG